MRKKREPEIDGHDERRRMRWISIQQKCHPVVFDMSQLWKESIEDLKKASDNPSKEAVEALEARFLERAREINNRYPDLKELKADEFCAQNIFSEPMLTSKSTSQGITEWLHFERHRIPMKRDMELMKAGDWDASQRVQRTIRDIEQIRCGKGPIRPFQGNLEHSNIFETMWGLGVEKLTQEELADFFDRYCPCGEAHDPGALKKHRERFRKALEGAIVAGSGNHRE